VLSQGWNIINLCYYSILHFTAFSILNIRKRFFIERVVSHWNRLPREMVMAPSLSELKKHLEDTLSHMV